MVDFFGCDCCRWLVVSLGHFLFEFQEDGAISCPVVGVSFVEHVKGLVLNSAPTTVSI
jgi:hypothetical protein